MAIERNEEQIRADKIAQMGRKLGEVHFLLWKDLTWLHFEWDQYFVLFGTDPSRIDLMNKAAPRFFWSLDRVLWQDILLSLSRLSDPPGTKGQENLTFLRLLRVLPSDGPRKELELAINEYEKAVKFARDWRHRLYAHRELSHALDPDVHSLQLASRECVIDALKAAAQVMNVLENHYEHSTTGYAMAHEPIGSGYDLLYYLDRGVHARETEDEDSNNFWEPRFK
jgi:hypothetical protein